MGEVSYKGHRYPAEIIAHCVWLYHRFPLSFREVIDRHGRLDILINNAGITIDVMKGRGLRTS